MNRYLHKAWAHELKECLQCFGKLNDSQASHIATTYLTAIASGGDVEQGFIHCMDEFGQHTDKALSQAKAEVSKLEKDWESRMAQKYGITRLQVENKLPDIVIDKQPDSEAKHFQDRLKFLKHKFKMAGMAFDSYGWNGGMTHLSRSGKSEVEPKPHGKHFEALGTFRDKKVKFEIEVS